MKHPRPWSSASAVVPPPPPLSLMRGPSCRRPRAFAREVAEEVAEAQEPAKSPAKENASPLRKYGSFDRVAEADQGAGRGGAVARRARKIKDERIARAKAQRGVATEVGRKRGYKMPKEHDPHIRPPRFKQLGIDKGQYRPDAGQCAASSRR